MKKLFFIGAITVSNLLLHVLFINPVYAQTATYSATPTPSSDSALLEAGSGSATMMLILLGLMAVVVGSHFLLGQTQKKI